MAYATRADMLLAFGERQLVELTDIGEPRLDAIDDAVLQQALDSASKLIDGYLVGRYQLPLATPVDALQIHCQGVARYLLMSANPDDRAKADYEAAISILMAVAKGAIPLMAPSQAQQPAGVGSVVFAPGQKVFAREEL